MRVSDTLKKVCDEVGPERVRQVLSDALLSDGEKPTVSDSAGKVVRQGKVSDASDKSLVESVRHPLEDEVTESGAPSWPGPYGGGDMDGGGGEVSDSPAVPTRASVVRPAVKVFSRTEEERAEKLKKLGGMLGVGGNEEQNQEP